MKNRIGAFINAYVHHSIEDALKGISNAGFRNVELLSTPGLAKDLLPDPEQITQRDIDNYLTMCRKYELSINGIYYYKGGRKLFDYEAAVDRLKKMVDMAVKFGSPYVITDTDEVDSTDREKYFYRYIRETCDYAQSNAVIVCLDIHGDWCRSGKRAVEILRKVGHPQLGINYCTGNVIYYEGVRPEEDIEHALPYMRRIHIKDSSGIYRNYDFPALGEGTVNFRKIFNCLKGFQGPMNAELDFASSEKPLEEINEALKRSFVFLKGLDLEI
ncbi:MAG: sugar phosphate isomerase/epimerase [Spirochaetota bacterium]|nr:MAG: sugar phosphate isomerase/epimerase [Spirochaetota bacterium]